MTLQVGFRMVASGGPKARARMAEAPKTAKEPKNNLRAGPLGLNPLLVTMVTGLE